MTEHNSEMKAHGHFEVSTRKPGEDWSPWEISPNIVVTEGMNYILSAAMDGAAPITAFYIAPFSGNVTPVASWTGANWVANATEFTNYVESTRPLWQKGDAAAGALGNADNPAVITAGVGGGTVRGAVLVENATKGSTAGKLIAAMRLTADKALSEGEELRLRYVISASST